MTFDYFCIQNLYGFKFNEDVTPYERMLEALFTAFIYMDWDPEYRKSVALTDFTTTISGKTYHTFMKDIVGLLSGQKLTPLSQSQIIQNAGRDFRNRIQPDCSDLPKSCNQILRTLRERRSSIWATVPESFSSCRDIVNRHLDDSSVVDRSILSTMLIIDFDVAFNNNSVVSSTEMSFAPQRSFNVCSNVYYLMSIIYVSHNDQFIVSFVFDGMNFNFNRQLNEKCEVHLPDADCFSQIKTIADLKYYPTLLFYQKKTRFAN